VLLLPPPTACAPLTDWDDLPYAVVNHRLDDHRVKGEGLQRVPLVKSPDGDRTLIIPRFAVQMPWRRNPGGTAAGPVFPDARGGWRDLSSTSRDQRNACGSEGFRWVTFHVFRKTCATIQLRRRPQRPGGRGPTRTRSAVDDARRLHGPEGGRSGGGSRAAAGPRFGLRRINHGISHDFDLGSRHAEGRTGL
jgi:hypothetical protein